MIKANTEYYNLEKVAEVLSIGTAEVNRLREQGKLRGLRDGNTWKFFKEEVHNYLAETIRARSAGDRQPGESDFDLADGATSSASSSFDLLMEDAALPNDSDLVSVAPVQVRPASDLDLAALDQDDELSLAEETQISSLVVPKKAKPKDEASSVSSSVIPVQVDEDSSALILADAEDIDVLIDEASVLEASGSSPQLGLAGDSGFDVLVAGEDESVLILEEEKTEAVMSPVMPDFELVPSPAVIGDDDSESSSQVIAIDAFAGMGQDADPFGQQDGGFGGGMDFGFDAGGFDHGMQQAAPVNNDPFGTGTPDVFTASTPTVTPTKPVKPVEEYSTGTLVALVFALVAMMPPGLMLIDTMLSMWSWSEPFFLNSILMDTISGAFGL